MIVYKYLTTKTQPQLPFVLRINHSLTWIWSLIVQCSWNIGNELNLFKQVLSNNILTILSQYCLSKQYNTKAKNEQNTIFIDLNLHLFKTFAYWVNVLLTVYHSSLNWTGRSNHSEVLFRKALYKNFSKAPRKLFR